MTFASTVEEKIPQGVFTFKNQDQNLTRAYAFNSGDSNVYYPGLEVYLVGDAEVAPRTATNVAQRPIGIIYNKGRAVNQNNNGFTTGDMVTILPYWIEEINGISEGATLTAGEYVIQTDTAPVQPDYLPRYQVATSGQTSALMATEGGADGASIKVAIMRDSVTIP